MSAPVAPDIIPQFSHAQIVKVISGIVLCILLAALDQTVVVPAVPAIAADLNGFGHLSWIVSAYLLTSTAVTPIYGKLSDIYGRRALLIPAIVLFVVASVLCALAGSLAQLIVFRAIQGIGGGGLMAMAQAAIADVVSPRERGRYQGYMASTWGIASIAGPIVGGYVTDHLSWRYVFWINLPLGLAAIFLSNRALKMLTVQREQARIDYLGAALLSAAVASWLLLLSWGGVSYAWTSPECMGLFVLGAALIAILAVHERRDADPLLPPRLFANAVFVRGVIVAFFASLGMFSGIFLLPLFFQLIHGADAGQSGVLVMPYLLFSTVGAYAAGQAARRLGRTKGLLLIGLSLAAAGFVALAVLGRGTPELLAVLFMSGLGIGIGIVMPTSLVLVQNAAERRDVGVATGTMLFLRSMGGAFGSTVAGAVLASRFAAGLRAHGIARPIDLGAMRGGARALHGMGPDAVAVAQDSLAASFHLSFGITAALMAVAVAVVVGLRDVPLRSAGQPAAIGH